MDDERKYEILREAFENLERLQDLQVTERGTEPDVLEAWQRQRPEAEQDQKGGRPHFSHKLDTPEIDWSAVIAGALAEERERMLHVLAGVIAEMRAQANDDLERATRSLTVELSELKATLAEVRQVIAAGKGGTKEGEIIDLPTIRRNMN